MFLHAAREHYDLEGLWNDAPRVPIEVPRRRARAGSTISTTRRRVTCVKITLAAVGRLKEPYLVAAEAEYTQAAAPVLHARPSTRPRTRRRSLAALPAGAHVYAFDERGDVDHERASSPQLLGAEARTVAARRSCSRSAAPTVTRDALRARATQLLAFGKMTIAHRLVRVLVLEQLYRGFKILRGEPYHRD